MEQAILSTCVSVLRPVALTNKVMMKPFIMAVSNLQSGYSILVVPGGDRRGGSTTDRGLSLLG